MINITFGLHSTARWIREDFFTLRQVVGVKFSSNSISSKLQAEIPTFYKESYLVTTLKVIAWATVVFPFLAFAVLIIDEWAWMYLDGHEIEKRAKLLDKLFTISTSEMNDKTKQDYIRKIAQSTVMLPELDVNSPPCVYIKRKIAASILFGIDGVFPEPKNYPYGASCFVVSHENFGQFIDDPEGVTARTTVIHQLGGSFERALPQQKTACKVYFWSLGNIRSRFGYLDKRSRLLFQEFFNNLK